jgi:hypothetical protein
MASNLNLLQHLGKAECFLRTEHSSQWLGLLFTHSNVRESNCHAIFTFGPFIAAATG